MSNVEFEEGGNQKKFLYSRFEPSNRPPGLIRLLMKIKFLRNETQALYVILACILAILITTFIILYKNTSYLGKKPQPTQEYNVEELNERFAQ